MGAGVIKMKGPTWNKLAAHDKWHQFYIILKGKGNMKRRILLVCGTLIAASVFGGEFPNDFQSAVKLYNSGKYAAAQEAFIKLQNQTNSKRGIDECLAYTAYSFAQQKNIPKAMEYAGKINDKAMNMFCRMKLLEIQKKWDELISLCKDEDFENWPEYMIYDACSCRANAYTRIRNAEKAEKDFLCAEKNTVEKTNKAYVYQYLGSMYQDLGKDGKKALDAYGEIVKLMTDPKPSMAGGMLGRALIARAKILAAQCKEKEALAELEVFKETGIKDPYWSCAVLLCYGEVYDLTGKNKEALENYRKAAAVGNGPAYLLEDAKQKIADMEEKMKK
jgi:tetratricopeptide (TPR) repeat protein